MDKVKLPKLSSSTPGCNPIALDSEELICAPMHGSYLKKKLQRSQ